MPEPVKLAHDQSQVEAADVHEHPLENIQVSAQVSSSHAAGFQSVSEAPFDQLAAFAHQPLATLAADAPAIGVHRVTLVAIAFPIPTAVFGLAHVTADAQFPVVADRLVRVVSLVFDQPFHRIRMNLLARLWIFPHRLEVLVGFLDLTA